MIKPPDFGKRQNVLSGLRWVSLAFVMFLALVFIAGQVVGIGGLDAALRKISPGSLALLLLFAVLSNALRFYRWPFLSQMQNLQLPTPRLALYYVAGMALLPTPGKLGTALRLWLIHRHHGLPYARTAPLLALDFLSDALAIVVLVAAGLIAQAPSQTAVAPAGLRLGLLMLIALLGGIVAVFYYPAVAHKGVDIARQLAGGRAEKFFTAANEAITRIAKLVGPKNLLLITGMSVAGWLLVTIALAVLLAQLGYGFNWPLATFALGGSMALGALSMLPGGLGSTEAGMLAILLAAGVSLPDATLLTALTRLVTLWLPVGAGAAVLPFALRKKRA